MSDAEETHRVECRLDAVLVERGMSVAELARRVGITVVNLLVLKNNRAKAIRFSTLTAICEVLDCQPADLFTVRRQTDSHRVCQHGDGDPLEPVEGAAVAGG